MSRKMTLDRMVYQALQSINCVYEDIRSDMYEKFTGVDAPDNLGKKEFKDIEIEKYGEKMKLSELFIFSNNGIKNANIMANAFVNWVKEQRPEIEKVSEITTQDAINFLTYKKEEEDCSASTIKTYKYAMHKLSVGIENKGWGEGFYSKDIKEFDSGEKYESVRHLSQKQVEQTISYAINNNLKWSDALKVQSLLGLRVEEIVKLKGSDILLGEQPDRMSGKFGVVEQSDTVLIRQSKGGLTRNVPIPADAIPFFQQLKDTYGDNKIFDGLNRQLYGQFLGRITYNLFGEKMSATHEIRKYWALKAYLDRKDNMEDMLRRALTPAEKTEIMYTVTSLLGHGSGRSDLVNIYIKSGL